MFADIDLRDLAEISGLVRAFLSIYLATPKSAVNLEHDLKRMRRVLKGSESEKDEQAHFDENVKRVMDYLDHHSFKSGSLCLFACWALDFFKACPLTVGVKDSIRIDSSPYIRPLAELQDEYENVAVVVADNKKARIYVVSSGVATDEERVRGNVKNHVKKGGWSQQRYERRRDKQLLHYAREIVEALAQLDRDEDFRRVILVGGKETLRAVHEELPDALRKKVCEKAIDLRKPEDAINADIMELFVERERQSEADLWERIRAEYLRGGLGVAGVEDVLEAVQQGRVEKMIVDRTYAPKGCRCRDCENLEAQPVAVCSACGSSSVFEVELVNEIVELAEKTSAEVDFADLIPELKEAGQIAALLRY